jgi:hypothetical protein
MRALLLGLAASAAAMGSAPARAVDLDHQVFVGNPTTSVQGGFVRGRHDGRVRRHSGDDGSVLIYDRDYQGDSIWKSDSFNDWWHDRPERAYPRWMVNNQNCEKQWYQGDVLRC